MKSLEEIKEEVKEVLSEERYEHSLGVMEKAVELAKEYGEDEQKAALVGITHDIAKEMSFEESLQYIEDNNIEISTYDKEVPATLHGIIAADMTSKRYGFTKEMQDAIKYHTTARENMTLLDKILYVADKTEPRTRNYSKLEEYNNVIREKGLDKAVLFGIEQHTIQNAINKRKLLHINSILARNDIIRRTKDKTL